MSGGPDGEARVVLVLVGSELLEGLVPDRNGARLARAVAERGGRVTAQRVVGDEVEAIASEVRDALEEADGVVVSGGIGPTPDDRTRAAVSRATGRPLEERPGWLRTLRDRREGYPAETGTARRQAELPRGARLIDNPTGTAAGFGLETGDGWALVLPGVPLEVEEMLRGEAGEYLGERLPGRVGSTVRVALAGVPEAEVAGRIDGLPELEGLRVASYPRLGTVELVLRGTGTGDTGTGAERLEEAAAALRREFGGDVYEVGERELQEVLLGDLRASGETVAIAESCTGGWLGRLLTAVPGASDAFWGGVVAYADRAKRELLGVSATTLAEHGSVSEATAREMAGGVRARSGATWGVAVTGVAGPEGGTEEKPVGTVWIAVEGLDSTVRRWRFSGGREEVRARSVTAALDALRRARSRAARVPEAGGVD